MQKKGEAFLAVSLTSACPWQNHTSLSPKYKCSYVRWVEQAHFQRLHKSLRVVTYILYWYVYYARSSSPVNHLNCIAVGGNELHSQSAASFTSSHWNRTPQTIFRTLVSLWHGCNEVLTNPTAACLPDSAAQSTCSEPYQGTPPEHADPAPLCIRHEGSHSPVASAAYVAALYKSSNT